jgi:hypothetical protein
MSLESLYPLMVIHSRWSPILSLIAIVDRLVQIEKLGPNITS